MLTCQDAVRGWVLRQGTVGLSLIAIPSLALAFVDLRPICCPDSLSWELNIPWQEKPAQGFQKG